MLKNKKILSLLAIILVIIIVGIVMLCVKGMNYSLEYGKNTTVELYLKTEFENADIQNTIKEVFGENTITRNVNNLEYDILIITNSVQDEQLNDLVAKVQEKYGLELKVDDLIVTNNANIALMDLISPYILPIFIATVIIIAYFIIRYKKLHIYNVLLTTILAIVLVQLLLLSIYSITRLPINQLTMPISMLLYIATIIVLIEKFEKDLQKYTAE